LDIKNNQAGNYLIFGKWKEGEALLRMHEMIIKHDSIIILWPQAFVYEFAVFCRKLWYDTDS